MSISNRLSLAQFRSFQVRRQNKYGAHRSCGYASAIEAERAAQLALLAHAGKITDLREQQTVYLTDANISYRPDFSYMQNGRQIHEDVKGVRTDRFRLICKLWRHYGPGVLRITERRGGEIATVQEIVGCR